MLTVYGLKNCDSCRRALHALTAAGKDYQFVDIRTSCPDEKTLSHWCDQVGVGKLVNTRSTTWRSLKQSDRKRVDSDAAGLLSEHPTLIKRPVIEAGDHVSVGWTKDAEAAHLQD